MPRKKISEFRAKKIVCTALSLPYFGISIDAARDLKSQLEHIPYDRGSFAVKIDQGVKGRYKKGLVALDVPGHELEKTIISLRDKGYRWMIVEHMISYSKTRERYLSLSRERNSIRLRYSEAGGIDIETNADTVHAIEVDKNSDLERVAVDTKINTEQLYKLLNIFNDNHLTLLEINPYIIDEEGNLYLLDLAIEVDSAGEFFTQLWSDQDYREYSKKALCPEEMTVTELAKKSPASFKLDLINPNGSIFLLLSGGGASVVIADEIHNQGFGSELANYGEYSGNPNPEETQIYASSVLSLLIKSKAAKKVLFIGGAVANFTDIAATFSGVIKALDEVADQLKAQSVKVYVRRGGPRQEQGLAAMNRALKKHGILGAVHNTDTSLTDAVKEVLEGIS